MTTIDRNIKLSQRMVQELGRMIVCGEYTNDSFPTEAELCESFGVSRSAVREAVKMLSAKGLIASKPKQGIRIQPEDQWNIFDPDLLQWVLHSKPSLQVLKEFLQVRTTIEPGAAALAASDADEESINNIEKALERMRRAEVGTREELEADIAFHVSILYASKNRFYIRLRDFISTALSVSISHTTPIKGNYAEIVEDHTKVFRAIKNRNPERARQTMFALVDEALCFIEDEISRLPQ